MEGAKLYKLVLEDDLTLQGMLMLTLVNDEMLYMNNIEVAPQNYGSQGKYDKVAGCLIAFACLKSFEMGKDYYKGYLTFQSKTDLITFYQKKYGAVIAGGHRMFIEPNVGTQLIEEYLNQK